MNRKYGLDSLPQQVMELLWNTEKSLSYEEILASVKSGWGRKRRIRKLRLCLSDLQKAGIIAADEKGIAHTYYAACTKAEFIDYWGKEQIRNYFNSSDRLFGIFPAIKKMSEEDIEELRKLL